MTTVVTMVLEYKQTYKMVKTNRIYTVWVGAMEVNDEYQTLEDAEKLARQFTDRGYDDVVIEKIQIK